MGPSSNSHDIWVAKFRRVTVAVAVAVADVVAVAVAVADVVAVVVGKLHGVCGARGGPPAARFCYMRCNNGVVGAAAAGLVLGSCWKGQQAAAEAAADSCWCNFLTASGSGEN